MAQGIVSIGEIRKKVTKTHEYISTSYHEAGHAIYALLNGMKVSSVFVYENKKLKRIHGMTYYDYPSELEEIQDPDLVLLLVKADIKISYAGLVAEKHLFKSISGSSQTPLFISDGSGEDNKSARETIKKYNLAPPGRKRAAYKAKMIREVHNDLIENWDAIMLVAHELFAPRRLNYTDLQELLTKRSKNKKYWKEQFKKINYFYENKDHLDEKDLRSILSK